MTSIELASNGPAGRRPALHGARARLPQPSTTQARLTASASDARGGAQADRLRFRKGVFLPAPDDAYACLSADLMRAVTRICPAWLAAQRDDVVQVALLRVMDVRRRSDAELKPAYLRRVAWSALVDEIRARRRRREVSLDDDPVPDARPARGPSPEEQVATLEIGQAIGECVTRLAHDRRLAVTLHLQGHSVPESAALLAWSPKRTENLVYRGLADLRACLDAKGLRP